MAVLLLRPPQDVGQVLVGRLVRQSDQVRIVDQPGDEDRWRGMGAHLAWGDPADLGLVCSAALGCRTIVAFSEMDLIRAAEAARASGVERVVGLLDVAPPAPERASWGVDHVILTSTPKRRLRFRSGALSPHDLAEAIDAADDLAGHPRLTLDLGEPTSWGWLNLSPPG